MTPTPEQQRVETIRKRVGEALKTPCAHASHAPMLRDLLDQLEQAEQREKGLRAALTWCFAQLRGWWQGTERDLSYSDVAIAELDRMERALAAQSEGSEP